MTSAGNLHPKVVRVPLQIGASVSSVQTQVAGLAAKGEQALLMAEFYGSIPSTSQAQSLAGWAHAFGPGGTFWQGRSDGNLAVRYIEFGNETNESYQFGGVNSGPSYTSRAQNYALRAEGRRRRDQQPSSGNPGVGLLASGRQRRLRLLAVGRRHVQRGARPEQAHRRLDDPPLRPEEPLRPDHGPGRERTRRSTATPRCRSSSPSTASPPTTASCLDSNYDWPTCLTYQQAADSLHGAIADLHSDLSAAPRRAVHLRAARHGHGSTSSREDNFGALKSDGSPKGAFTDEIQNELNTYRG